MLLLVGPILVPNILYFIVKKEIRIKESEKRIQTNKQAQILFIY